MRAKILLAAMLLVATGTLAGAEEKPVNRADLDKKIVGAVYESAVLGTDLFNKGGHAECYRLYQGTLMALVPMLDHRAVLRDKVKMRLDRANKMKPADGAFELRTALDEIQNDIAPPKDKPKDVTKEKDVPKATTLWER